MDNFSERDLREQVSLLTEKLGALEERVARLERGSLKRRNWLML
jgi:hypothetical protein